jgi:OmpA-OmpF porin, OOP family
LPESGKDKKNEFEQQKGFPMIHFFRLIAVTLLAGILVLGTYGCSPKLTKASQTNASQSNEQAPEKAEKKVPFGPVYFDSSKTVLRPGALSVLYNAGIFLTKNPDYRLIIEAHADERGDPLFDKYISEERAKSVYNWLVLYGVYHINEKRVAVRTFGSSQLAQKNCGSDMACHGKNRRVELVAVK